jgi:hypothetical protein
MATTLSEPKERPCYYCGAPGAARVAAYEKKPKPEVCGQPGKQRQTGGGVRAVCDRHAHSPEEN